MATKSKSIRLPHTKLEQVFIIKDAECDVLEHLDTFSIVVRGMETELDYIQAISLRNRLSSWTNAKRYRDQRK